MKVLHVFCGPFPTYQGTQTLVRKICRLSSEHGIDTHLLCYHHGHPIHEQSFKIHRIINFPIFENEKSGPSFKKGILDLNIVLKTKRLLSKLKPDIIHAHHYEALLACKMASIPKKIPLIFHQHALFGPELPMYFSPTHSSFWQRVGTQMDLSFPKLADKIITVSKFGEQQLVNAGISNKHIEYMLPPSDTFPKVNKQLDFSCVYGVYMGNLDAYQNVDCLFKAVGQLKNLSPKQFKLKIITACNPLEHLPSDVAQYIEWIDHRNFHNAWHHTVNSDFCIIPRTLEGGIPIKLINALAAGLPTIIHPKIVPELTDRDAYLCDTSNHINIANAITELVTDSSVRKELSKNALAAHKRLFDAEEHIQQLIKIYKEMI